MMMFRRALPTAVGGSLYGVATSTVARLAATADGAPWAESAGALSLVLGAGWTWGAISCGAGFIAGIHAGGRVRYAAAAVAGFLAVAAAVVTYYASDSVLRDEPVSVGELAYWILASAVVGPPLGATGAAARRRDVLGLAAGLVVPIGAVTQMLLWPPGVVNGPSGEVLRLPAAQEVRLVVLVAAVAAAAYVVRRYARGARGASLSVPPTRLP